MTRQAETAAKPGVIQKRAGLLGARYDLADRPIPGVMMCRGGRKAVQGSVRVKLPAGTSWDQLAAMTPDQIRAQGLFPGGFQRLPHTKQAVGGEVFPQEQVDQIRDQERRDLKQIDGLRLRRAFADARRHG